MTLAGLWFFLALLPDGTLLMNGPYYQARDCEVACAEMQVTIPAVTISRWCYTTI